jgi:hypothetical protein
LYFRLQYIFLVGNSNPYFSPFSTVCPMKHTLFLPFLAVLFTTLFGVNLHAENTWNAGVARAIITPQEPIWQVGFSDRTEPAKEVIADLWAKALALKDADGNKGIIFTMDILGTKREVSDAIKSRIAEKHGLDRNRIILNSSHTHSGPAIMLTPMATRAITLDADRFGEIQKYTDWFIDRVVLLADEAFAKIQPVTIHTNYGLSRMQVNRRDNKGSGPLDNVTGPLDYSVPVMKVQAKGGSNEIIAVLFGYACHPTTLNINKFSGDWCGFAQEEIEKRYPGTTAMFFQGACGDLTVFPRNAENYSRLIGESIAVIVACMLKEPMTEQKPSLAVAYTEVALPYGWQPSQDELEMIALMPNPIAQSYAEHLLQVIKEQGTLDETYPCYPVQAWRIGDLPLFTLGGEVLVQYSIHTKRMFGEQAFVMAYSNDMVAYIPTARAIREGGYEVMESQIGYGRHGRWAPEIEKIIVEAVALMGEQVGFKPDRNRVEWTE